MNARFSRPCSCVALSLAAVFVLTMHASSQTPAQHLKVTELATGQSPEKDLARWQSSFLPDGRWRTLKLQAQAEEGTLPVPSGRVLWAGLFPEALLKESGKGVQVVGKLDAVEELNALGHPPAVLPVPPGINVASHMQWTAFGVEERVQPVVEEQDGEWKITEGQKPAGLYSAALWRLPSWPRRAAWKVELTLKGQGEIEIGLSADTGKGFGDPPSLQRISLNPEGIPVSLKVPAAWNSAKALRLNLVTVPKGTRDLSVASVTWKPEGTSKPKGDSAPPRLPLGVWDWSAKPELWLKRQVAWKDAGLSVLQLALPQGSETESAKTALSELKTAGFSIVAVEGDPHMILPGERKTVLQRHKQLGETGAGLLTGVQYDVEPYLLPGFRLQPARWYQQWAELYGEISASSKMRAEAVVPFWLLGQEHGQSLLQKLAGFSRRVVVMNYRSDLVEAASWGTLWLEWGARHEHPVSLAVECGPISDTPVRTFRAAKDGDGKGRLWINRWEGQGTAVVIYEDPVSAGETGTVLTETRESVVSGDRTTMQHRPPEDVKALLQSLEGVAAKMSLPASVKPVLLLHEPGEAVLENLSR